MLAPARRLCIHEKFGGAPASEDLQHHLRKMFTPSIPTLGILPASYLYLMAVPSPASTVLRDRRMIRHANLLRSIEPEPDTLDFSTCPMVGASGPSDCCSRGRACTRSWRFLGAVSEHPPCAAKWLLTRQIGVIAAASLLRAASLWAMARIGLLTCAHLIACLSLFRLRASHQRADPLGGIRANPP